MARVCAREDGDDDILTRPYIECCVEEKKEIIVDNGLICV
jgi:hypothetical protein